MPLVSVVIPTHNRAHVVCEAVESVLAQTVQDFEVIVVDDRSKDDTLDRLADLRLPSPKFRVIRHEKNRGAQAARNSGARIATGEWLSFLDSDDKLLPQSLEMRLQAATSEKVQVVHSECYVLKGDVPQGLFGVPPVRGRVYRSLLRHPGPMFQGLLISAQVFEQMGGLDERIVSHQEWDTSIRLAKICRFGFGSEPTFIWDCRGTDTMSKDARRSAEGYRQVVLKHFTSILTNLGPKAMSGHYRAIASYCSLAGDAATAAKHRRTAFAWWPDSRFVMRKILRLL